MAAKDKRIKCAACGERETVSRGERGPVTAYCDVCREERKREQARARMQAMRQRRPPGSPGLCQIGLDGRLYPHQDPVEL